jgi:hypothetical protein
MGARKKNNNNMIRPEKTMISFVSLFMIDRV